MSPFGLTDNELAFLVANVGPSDVVFEWGSGDTTRVLAAKCRHVTAVEHQAPYAVRAIKEADGRRNVSIVYAPPDFPYVEGTENDGDLATFRTYVESYSGRGVDVVLVDGRARVEAVRFAVERAPFGPHPGVRIFVHDMERPSYAPIFELVDEVSRADRLVLFCPKGMRDAG